MILRFNKQQKSFNAYRSVSDFREKLLETNTGILENRKKNLVVLDSLGCSQKLLSKIVILNNSKFGFKGYYNVISDNNLWDCYGSYIFRCACYWTVAKAIRNRVINFLKLKY